MASPELCEAQDRGRGRVKLVKASWVRSLAQRRPSVKQASGANRRGNGRRKLFAWVTGMRQRRQDETARPIRSQEGMGGYRLGNLVVLAGLVCRRLPRSTSQFEQSFGGPKWVNRLDSSDDCGCDTSWGTLLKKGRRKLRIRDYYEGSARKTIERERETQESGQSRQCKVVAGSAQQSDDCDLLSRPKVVNCGGRGKNRPGSGRG